MTSLLLTVSRAATACTFMGGHKGYCLFSNYTMMHVFFFLNQLFPGLPLVLLYLYDKAYHGVAVRPGIVGSVC